MHEGSQSCSLCEQLLHLQRGWSKEVGAFVMVDLDGGSEEWQAVTMHYCSDARFGRVKVYA
jgi:hypothetical protein